MTVCCETTLQCQNQPHRPKEDERELRTLDDVDRALREELGRVRPVAGVRRVAVVHVAKAIWVHAVAELADVPAAAARGAGRRNDRAS